MTATATPGMTVAWEAAPSTLPRCYHGGAFFEAIGPRFDNLHRRKQVINADVLDAWFDPSPRVLEALQAHLPWLLKTSPPTHAQGMIRAIAAARAVSPGSILPGAGSSDLIYLALRRWLQPSSRVLMLDPTYGEYAHVCEQVIGCAVERLPLDRAADFDVDPDDLVRRVGQDGYDMVVLVNPNSPTGRHLPAKSLRPLLDALPRHTRLWIDETYIDYVGRNESLEQAAAARRNVVVCKSMSKVYALSGVRAAYLCAHPDVIDDLRPLCPPWAVSLPAQVAAVAAVGDPDYYAERYVQTHALRRQLHAGLAALGLAVVPGVANFILAALPPDGPTAHAVLARARRRGVFIRDAACMGARLGPRCIRIAVKDQPTQVRLLAVLGEVVRCHADADASPGLPQAPEAA